MLWWTHGPRPARTESVPIDVDPAVTATTTLLHFLRTPFFSTTLTCGASQLISAHLVLPPGHRTLLGPAAGNHDTAARRQNQHPILAPTQATQRSTLVLVSARPATMDSMRSLNTSLPRTRRRQSTPQPDTHKAFKDTALAVTNLYRTALADIERSRSDGYQQALEDLLGFLDKENLGVGDGEGWRIRQWATERLDGALPVNSTSDTDEDIAEEQRARSSSPVVEHVPEHDHTVDSEPALRCDSAPPAATESANPDSDMAPLPPMFHFAAPQSYPANNNNTTNNMDNAIYDFAAAARRAFPTPRRNSSKSSSRTLQRSAAQNLVSLGNGAGQKRKLVNDFFNMDFNHDRRDREGPGGGPKRGRMT